MSVFVIYEKPKDYPQGYVVRRWEVAMGSMEAQAMESARVATIEEARALIPEGLFRMDRALEDEPQIVETWI
jgi:hypothetical protein